MANTKEYQIKINGLTESISAVESLNKQLDKLEQRMKAINSSKVSTGGGSSASRGSNSALSEEEMVQKEINKLKEQGAQLDAKIAASQDEIYKRVDATKQLYKATIADQKAIAAQERLTANAYSNTMVGMKQQLADLKAVIQTVDLGDSDQISKMTEQANELTNKLKKMEEAYGQFGRNVGNYKSAAEGFKGLAIQVGDVTREFDNAKQALKELKKERDTLSTKKDLGLASPEEVERLKSLIPVVAQLQSSIQDAGKPMDAIMDTMQSIVAITQAGKGIAAFFGFDNDEIEKSIQKLVALQNAMQGLQTIQKQLQTQEGIGGWIQKGNAMIDSFVSKLTGASKAQKELNAATTAGATASKALTTAEQAQAVATSTATVATKALGVALKALGIGLIISAVAALVEYWDDLSEIITDTVPALKNVSTWFDKIKGVVVGVGTAIINWMVQPLATVVKIVQAIIEGNFSEIPKIITNGFKQTFDVVGNYQKGYNKEIERQQKAHNNKMLKEQKEANDEWLKDEEAKYGKSYQNTKKYLNDQMALINKQLANSKKGSKQYDELIKEQKEVQRKIWENEREYREKSKNESKKTAKEVAEAESDLNALKIANMKEGLNKVLKQLEEERKQKLAKIEADGRLVAERQAEINKLYAQKELDARKEWADKTQKVYKDMWDKIYAYNLENHRRIVESLKDSVDITIQKYQFGRSTKDAPYRISQENSSYGVQGSNQISRDTAIELQLQEQNNKKLRDTYDERLDYIEAYWNDRIAFEYTAIDKLYQAEVSLEKASFRREISELNDNYREYNEKLKEAVKNGTMIEEDAYKLREKYEEEYYNKQGMLIAEHNDNLEKLQIERVKKIQNINAEHYRERLQELRDFQTAISNLEAKQPVINSWNITNLGETWKNNDNLLMAYRKLADEIVVIKRKLQKELDENKISFDDFQQANRELDSFADNVGQKMDKVKYEMSGWFQTGQLIQDINQYMQRLGQSIQEVFSAIWDYQDYQTEKELEELDRWNDELDKALDKQQEIVEEHKNAVDSIEDELATARGDRRQHLIDQLNAEIAAQRAAQKEEQRIKKEQERAKQREEAIEKKRRQEEYERNVTQAFISWHLSIANGLATQPFMPLGIAMGALATVLGAAQYALVKSQKPYAKGGQLDGGVAQGARHRDGGIPVLGGRASIEGGEFITNRRTTAQNVDLLEFVNSKHRKLSIDDFIDFYSTTPRKVIRGVRTKFEDGGYLPTLPSTLDVKDQLQNIVINQDNRPIVVSVVDINNKQDQVRRVQTLAGL